MVHGRGKADTGTGGQEDRGQGIIPQAEWNAILAEYTVRRIEIPYTRYSANTKKEKEGRKEVLELLYVIQAKV